ncbi:MAG: type II 3-dehydroquinate dehydratase [Rhodospirillales bacterium]|nr:type II 3-dehydroquinate dehydratase [Rhodospirillales bacterium]
MAMTSKILVLNGPNLNLLGTRQPELYGSLSLSDIQAACEARGRDLGFEIDFRQSNSEGEMVEWVQQARGVNDGVIVNAGAYTHTSVALLDALLTYEGVVIEVHLSNIYQRDEFRHHSYVSKAADGVICGLGGHGYELALEALQRIFQTRG